MIEKLIKKLNAWGDRSIEEINQSIFKFSKIVGDLGLLVNLVEDGKEIENAKKKLPDYLKKNEELIKLNKYCQKIKDNDLIEYGKKMSGLLNEYGNKVTQLKELLN